MPFLNFERYLLAPETTTGDDDLIVTGTVGTTDNLAKWDAAGNIEDAGVAVNDSGTAITELWTASKTKTYVDALVVGAIVLQGDWNASTNTPNISGTTTTGYSWRVSVAGTTTLGSVSSWAVGDMAVKTAASWIKVDNEDIGALWGNITGTLSAQTDLQSELNAKEDNIVVSDTNSIDLTFSGQTISADVKVDDTTIEIDVGTGLRVKDSGITPAKLAPGSTSPTITRYYRGDGSWQEQASGVASVGDTASIEMDMTAGVITAEVLVIDGGSL